MTQLIILRRYDSVKPDTCLFYVRRYIGLFHDAVGCLDIYSQFLGSAVNNKLNRLREGAVVSQTEAGSQH
jgi:hypothetical protein